MTLDLEREDGGILVVRLNRPEFLNAFTVKMASELIDLFTLANDDDATRAIVVTGAGNTFCAGMDLRREGNVFGLDETLRPGLEDMRVRLDDPAVRDGVRDTGGRVTLAIYACRKPVIAAIDGAAVGIGATMTLAMDFRLATPRARIGFVFSRLGIVPEACSSWFLPRLVGLQRALEWTYSGQILSGQEALEGGLLHSLHEPEALRAAALELARQITTDRSPVSVALIRQMMMRNMAADQPLKAHQVESLAMFYTSIGDGKRGIRAFLDKAQPSFSSNASTMPDFYDEWISGR
ncbi:crotonase/enoyl-CoA hydratase family protein [Bradyrhizobium erythrophlei]|uniref:crotonase/enoyl-CoA hydratase family protein n=1 Tax=Bradyrhizobium erythrophlei TaxID=1437360 RepID=UPI0035E5E6E6